MAFGYADTDAFYDHLLAPVLHRNRITPVIISRTHSNDDLNAQIIKQLLDADFAVCDLTYARPSVYFEAGFAQRSTPVIYTVRRDHLLPGQPNDLRVHFDLQMKPLIAWADTDDHEFSVRFEKRLRSSILRDLNRDRQAAEAIGSARADFGRRPLAQRLVDVRYAAISALTAASFGDWRPVAPMQPCRAETVLAGRMNNVRGERSSLGRPAVATINAYEALPKSSLQALSQAFKYDRSVRGTSLLAGDDTGGSDIHHFVFSLRGLPASRIESAFPTLSRQPGDGTYVDAEEAESGQIRTYWHFVAPVLSEVDVARTIQMLDLGT